MKIVIFLVMYFVVKLLIYRTNTYEYYSSVALYFFFILILSPK